MFLPETKRVGAMLVVPMLAAWAAAGAESPVRPYLVPDAVQDGPYRVRAGNIDIPVEQGAHVDPVYYARFRMTDPVTIEVETAQPGRFTIKPLAVFDEPPESIEGSRIEVPFIKPGPRVVAVERDGTWDAPLILLAYADGQDPEPPEDRPLVDVSHLAGRGEDALVTETLQAIFDEHGATSEGATVYFGPGIYHTGSLRVTGRTFIYLAEGALVVGSGDPEHYVSGSAGRQMMLFEDCEEGGLIGSGVLDGRGHVMQVEHGAKANQVRFLRCRDMIARGVVLRNAAAWAFHILGCERVRVEDLAVVNDWGLANTDGVNPDNSTDVRIARYFGHCGDDAVTVKATNRAGVDTPCRDIDVRDSVVMTKKSALKVGTESRQDIFNVLFENIDIVHSSRGLALWMRDGATFSDITYRDIRMDLIEVEGEGMSGEPFRVIVQHRDGIGLIRDVLFENIRGRAPYRALIQGHAEQHVQDLTFRNIEWTVLPRTIKTEPQPVFEITRADGLVIEGLRVVWHEAQLEEWDGFIRSTECENLRTEDVVHEPDPF